MITIWCALESPHLGQPFKYLRHHHITHRKFFRDTWNWKIPQKLTKTQKFRESQLALKNKISSFAHFLKPSFTSTVHNVTIWCALDSTGLEQSFKYFERYHITRRKVFRATWSWKMPQKLTKTQKFRKSHLALKNKIWGTFQLQVVLKNFYGWYDNAQGIQRVFLNQGYSPMQGTFF